MHPAVDCQRYEPVAIDPNRELYSPVETNLATHHELILESMDRTTRRRYGRLLMMMPPGAAKTTYASIVFPAYYLGRNRSQRIALGSYGKELAIKMGRKTKSVILQPRYKALFNKTLSTDSRAANFFTLSDGSEYMADSLSGAFPGNRFDGLIADDPIKGRAQANSEVERGGTWDEFTDNFMSRVVPGGWLVVIMTHWDEEDPAGHILPDGWAGDSGMFKGRHDGLDWEVLCLQARCETTTDPLKRRIGEYLWPQWFDRTHWSQFENDARGWNSLYQQRPRPIEGAFFHSEDMLVDGKPIAIPQKVDYVFGIIDSAVKTGKTHDGLAVMFFARSILNNINVPLAVLDWELTQIKGAFLINWLPTVFERLEEYAKECSAFQGVAGVWIEDKVSGTILLQQADGLDQYFGLVHAIEGGLTAMGKKERAISVSGHAAAGKIKWTERAWTRAMTYKGSTKNHAISQILKVSMDSKDNEADDCLDTYTYGIAISLGNSEGY